MSSLRLESSPLVKRGRPSREKVVKEVDWLSGLRDGEKLEVSLFVDTMLEVSKAEKAEAAKAEKKALAEAAKAEKKALAEAVKAEKKALAEAAKVAKKAEADAAKAAKKAEADAAKAAKKAEADAAKAKKNNDKKPKVKKEKDPSDTIGSAKVSAVKKEKESEKQVVVATEEMSELEEEEMSDEEEEEEVEVHVKRFMHEGTRWLRDTNGVIYDEKTQEAVGVWCEETKSIVMDE